MATNKITQLAQLYNRSARLLNSLRGKSRTRRNRDMATQYNILREDVKRFVSDPGFDRVIPPAWCFKPFRHILLALVVILSGGWITYFLLGSSVIIQILVVVVLMVLVGSIFAVPWLNKQDWFSASTIEQVWDRANVLHEYLKDYVDLNPEFSSRLRPEGEQKLEHQVEGLQSYNLELEDELETMRDECRRLKERLAGIETPSQFDVPSQVLDKLDQLEQTRLMEAVQAYRVNAWTPAAAVCGMILEGRLQRLCSENNIRPGGIGDMIRRLGEAGHLQSYYQNLAQVGEFFRHRASHPTSEEFDREKTTLVLTSLIILIRDLF